MFPLRMVSLFKWFLLVTVVMPCSKAGYVLRLELKSFSNPHHTLANGMCCEEQHSQSKTCSGACDVAFVFCWKNYNSESNSIAASACMSRGSTAVYGDGDSIDFSDIGLLPSNTVVPLSNPIEMRGDVWPGAIQMFVRVVDIDNGSERRLVDHFRLRESLIPATVTPFKAYPGLHHNTTIVARFDLRCMENFYQLNCSVFCESRDDTRLGHYGCAADTGMKVCLPGFTDPSSNCTTCATASECSPENGYCNTPNECICHTGYGGDLCQQDLDVCGHTRPCVRGTCTNTGPDSYECDCPEGHYGGKCQFYEDQMLCHDSPCENGGTCVSTGPNAQTCLCRDGYTGSTCTDDMNVCGHIHPCQNGATCVNTGTNAYDCQCTSDYNGTHCDLPIVSDNSIPRVPIIVGAVVGCLVLLSLIMMVAVAVLLLVKKKGCLSQQKRKLPSEQATTYAPRYSESSATSQSAPASSHQQVTENTDSNTATVAQQFSNPLYTETTHCYSNDDIPVHYYSIPNVPRSGVEHSRNPDSTGRSEREPVYTIISDEEVRKAREDPLQGTSNATTSRVQQQQPVRIDDYCEPADSAANRQPPLYHVLDSGPPNTNSGSTFGSPPPVYHVLEEPPAPAKAPISAWYEEARVTSGRGQPQFATTALPHYVNIGGQDKPAT